MNRLVPATNKLLIRPSIDESWTGSGLYLPETALSARNHHRRGTVIAAGPKAELYGIFVGDEVFYDRYSMTDLMVDGEVLAMSPVSDVIARVA